MGHPSIHGQICHSGWSSACHPPRPTPWKDGHCRNEVASQSCHCNLIWPLGLYRNSDHNKFTLYCICKYLQIYVQRIIHYLINDLTYVTFASLLCAMTIDSISFHLQSLCMVDVLGIPVLLLQMLRLFPERLVMYLKISIWVVHCL